jgi:type I restriction enzyme S subunit
MLQLFVELHPANEKHKEPSKGKIACLRTANVQDSIEWDDLLYGRKFVKRSEQLLKKAILLCQWQIVESWLKVAYIYNIPTGSATFGGLSVIRPYGFNADFLMSVLRSPNIKSILIDSSIRQQILLIFSRKVKRLLFQFRHWRTESNCSKVKNSCPSATNWNSNL